MSVDFLSAGGTRRRGYVLLLFLQLVLQRPVALVLLAGAGDGEGIGLHIVGDGGPGGNVRALAHVHGGDEVRVAADEGIIVNDGSELPRPVIVDRHGAAAEVDVLAHIAVADVGQVGDLCPVADGGVFDFDKVAAADMIADARAGTDVGERPDGRVAADLGVIDLRGVDFRPLADLDILQIAVRPDGAAVGDRRRAAQDGAGQNGRARADEDGRLDIGVVIVPDRDACRGKVLEDPTA